MAMYILFATNFIAVYVGFTRATGSFDSQCFGQTISKPLARAGLSCDPVVRCVGHGTQGCAGAFGVVDLVGGEVDAAELRALHLAGI